MYARRASLPAIVTMVRAGSLELAERIFAEAGYQQRVGDPAALAVLGRLRKERAARLPASERAAAYADAARAYAAADALAPQPYTRLNVATLTWLAGNRAAARSLAADLVAWLDRGEEIAETAYYLEATRAEALLLRGDHDGCADALARAIAADPDGWAEHAATLRQLATIAAAAGIDPAFLARFRPPRSLHFAGHLGVSADRHDALSRAVAELVARERIGFGFGALAAGSEIVIAEALLAAGAELHVFLPGAPEEFASVSIDPYGDAWRPRFERCLEAAVELRCFPSPGGGFQPLPARIANDVAMGAATMHAARLASEAVQLIVADTGAGEYGTGRETARGGALWRRTGARQHVLRIERSAPVAASGARAAPEGDPDLRLAALLHIAFVGLDALDEAGFARVIAAQLAPLRREAAALLPQPDLLLPAGNARIAAFADPADAWAYARGLLALPAGELPLRLAGHYGLAHWLDEPAALVGRALADLDAIAAGAVPGVLTVSEPLARVLQLAPGGPPRVEHVGEAGAIELYAVSEERTSG